jgi:hypothetical protein
MTATTILGILNNHTFSTMLKNRCYEIRDSIAIFCKRSGSQQVSDRIKVLNDELVLLEKMQSAIYETIDGPGMSATYEIKMTVVDTSD